MVGQNIGVTSVRTSPSIRRHRPRRWAAAVFRYRVLLPVQIWANYSYQLCDLSPMLSRRFRWRASGLFGRDRVTAVARPLAVRRTGFVPAPDPMPHKVVRCVLPDTGHGCLWPPGMVGGRSTEKAGGERITFLRAQGFGRPGLPVIRGGIMTTRSTLTAGGSGRQLATVFLLMLVVGAVLGGTASYLTTESVQNGNSNDIALDAAPESPPSTTARVPAAPAGGGVVPVAGASPNSAPAAPAVPAPSAASTPGSGAPPDGQPADQGIAAAVGSRSTGGPEAPGPASESPTPVPARRQPTPGPATTAPEPASTTMAPRPVPSPAAPTSAPPAAGR